MNVSLQKCHLLAVDDDPSILSLLASQLSNDFHVITACTVEQARGVIAERSVDILLSDLNLPDQSGLVLLDWARRMSPRTSRILLSGTARLQDAVDAINRSQIHRLVLKPWRGEDLIQTLHSAAQGLLLERSHEQLLDELHRLNLELEQRVIDRTRQLEAALAQVQQKSRILEQMALTDPLTQVPNKRAIDSIARKELLRRTRIPSPLAIGLIDADKFKQVNTDHLQTGGDHVLVWLSRILIDAIRASDAIGRVGGEEFLVVAPNTDMAGAEALGERLRSQVEESSTSYNGIAIKLTVSIGFAVADLGSSASLDRLREVAAKALKEAKEAGRNRCVILSTSSEGVAAGE